jgi:hypothetical protein
MPERCKAERHRPFSFTNSFANKGPCQPPFTLGNNPPQASADSRVMNGPPPHNNRYVQPLKRLPAASFHMFMCMPNYDKVSIKVSWIVSKKS